MSYGWDMSSPDGGRTYEFGIGDRLRAARSSLDLTMDDFANLIEVSKGTIANYENGKTSPERMSRPTLRAWAHHTGFDYNWLLTGESTPIDYDDPETSDFLTEDRAAVKGNSPTVNQPTPDGGPTIGIPGDMGIDSNDAPTGKPRDDEPMQQDI